METRKPNPVEANLISETEARNKLTRYFSPDSGRGFGEVTRIDYSGLIRKGEIPLHAFLVNTDRFLVDPIKATVVAVTSGQHYGWVGISTPDHWDYGTFLIGE